MDIVSFVIGYKNGWKNGQPEGQEKEVTIEENGTTIVKPDENKVLSKVTVKTKVGDGVSLNIAYGDTPPEDTSKLWVKTTKPNRVVVAEKNDASGPHELKSTNVPVSQAKADAAFCVYDNKIFSFGGSYGSGSNLKLVNTINCYDMEMGVYTTLSSTMPVAIDCMVSARSGSNIYLMAGVTNHNSIYGVSKKIYCFNADTLIINTLSITMSISTYYYKRFYHPEASKAYIYSQKSVNDTTGNIFCFDAETEKVTTVSSDYSESNIGYENFRAEYGLYDGDQYIYSYINSSIIRIDTASLVSEVLCSGPTKAARIPTWAIAGDIIFVSGGSYVDPSTGSGRNIPDTGFVDLKTGIVTEITAEERLSVFGIDRAVYGNCLVSVGKKIYILPGFNYYEKRATDNIGYIYEFTPPITGFELAPETLLITPQLGENKFPIINTDPVKVEIGVDSVYKGNSEGEGEEVEAALFKDGEWTTI